MRNYDPGELSAYELTRYTTFFSASQKRYLAMKEAQANATLMVGELEQDGYVRASLPDSFSLNSYERVRDLIEIVDFSRCAKAVMVDCGAFPATLLWLGDHFPKLHYVGLDIDRACVIKAQQLTIKLGWRNISFETVDGTLYDYTGVDFVYVANHVSPNKKTLERIAGSARPGLQVVVREPTRKGELFAEAVRPNLPAGYMVGTVGDVSSAFLSYDLSLTFS